MTISYNVTGSDRKALVGAIANKTGIKAKYLGMPSMAYEIGPITVDKTGGLTWPETATDSEIEHLVEQLAEAGFEVTVLADTDESDEDAHMDVSIPEDALSAKTMQNLQALVEAKGNLLKKALDADELPILKLKGEIHFPWFKLGSSAEESQAYMNLIEKLVEMAKNAKRVTTKEKEADNEKYAFRCFLLRLGFIGGENKGDRKILLRNLSGSSAFKSGRKKECEPGMDPVPTPENTVQVDVDEAMRRLQDPEGQDEIKAILNGEEVDV